MSRTTPSRTEPTRRVPSPRQVRLLAAAVFVVTTALTVLDADTRQEMVVVVIGVVVSLTVVYGVLLPQKLAQPGRGGTALILSVVAAVVLLPAFWSGQSLILGAAGVVLGRADRTSTSAGKSVAAIVLGSLACLGYFAVYALDALLPPSG